MKYVEQYYPELLQNLSSCRSPQGMFGSIAKKYLPKQFNIDPKNLVVVSIMPCTAKKTEALRPELSTDGMPDNDYVLTTQEIAAMIRQAGILFDQLYPESFDSPLSDKTGGGVIFGLTGGVTEAVLRYTVEKLSGKPLDNVEFTSVRNSPGIKKASLEVNDIPINIAIVNGLKNAKALIETIKSGEAQYDIVEVMSCPGGCVGGAGQPIDVKAETRNKRAKGLYSSDKTLNHRKSQENKGVHALYKDYIGEIGGEEAHRALHTHYHSRKRISSIVERSTEGRLHIGVCIGTNCFVKNSQEILKQVLNYVTDRELSDVVKITPSFCMENCGEGPNVSIGDKVISKATTKLVINELEEFLNR